MSKLKEWADKIQARRFDSAFHLGLGDIRLSRADGDELMRDLMEAAAAPQPEWIPTSERLPTREDADENARVWVYSHKEAYDAHYRDMEYIDATHWMPKRKATPPEPPR